VTAVPPTVSAVGLTVRYGPRVAVDNLDLSAERGEVLAVLGRNGAGKTTTVETCEGYRRPDAGVVRVLGLDPYDRASQRALMPRLGVMLQEGGVYPALPPREALRLFAAFYDHPVPPAELIERLDLGAVASTPWRRLSGGEKQRLSLGLALVGRPEVVFLDEPTAGVDPAGRVAIRRQIEELREAGVCVVLTTHELDEAERMADRIAILHRGRLLASGTSAELAGSDPAGPELRFGAPAGLDLPALSAALGAPVTEEEPGRYRAGGAAGPAAVARLTAWLAERDLALSELRTGRRLEEVFLRLTEDGETAEGGDRR
jgi:ABC-2 type transport system ATP-binding protein